MPRPTCWRIFSELNRKRTSNGFGPNPLLHSGMLAWSTLYQHDLESHEVRTVDAIDHLFMQHQAKAAKKQSKK